MRRFLLLMALAASAMYADYITSVSCTLGTNTQTGTTNCNAGSGFSGQFVGANAYVTEGVNGNQYIVIDQAIVVETADFGGSAYGAAANANDTLELGSGGSKRAGFIQFDIRNMFLTSLTSTLTASELFTDGVHQYSYQNSTGSTSGRCNSSGCEFVATLPFDLGTTFNTSISAEAAIGNGMALFTDKAYIDPYVTFSLLEADGKTSVPLFVTPEPSTWGLFLFGIVACSWLTAKKHQTRFRLSK